MLRRIIINLSGYLIVSVLAATSIGLELVQTRILSLLYYNHIVYLTVTVAMMGFGISSVYISIYYKKIKDKETMLLKMLEYYFLTFITCISLSSYLPVLLPNYPTLLKLIFSYSLLIIPFLFSGACISLIFLIYGKNSHKIYFADLVSACISVLVYVFFLEKFTAQGILWLNLALIVFAYTIQSLRLKISLAAPFVLTVFSLAGFIFLNGKIINEIPEFYKVLGRTQHPEWTTEIIEEKRWNPVAKIDIWSDPYRNPTSGALLNNASQYKVITQDGDALAVMLGPSVVKTISENADAGIPYGVISLIYSVRENPEDSLIIGVGGGVDIVMAKVNRAKNITGVELNSSIVDLTENKYADFLQWPKWDNVNLVRAEGRNFLSNHKDSYDTIFVNGVDTFSALNSGAYVLSENYLYTVEAIKDFALALKPDGVAGISRWLYSKPRESLRLSATILESLKELGINEPEKSVFVLAEDYGWPFLWGTTLFKTKPFTRDEITRVLDKIEDQSAITAVYIPDVFEEQVQKQVEEKYFKTKNVVEVTNKVFKELMMNSQNNTLNSFYDNYEYRIDPVRDDRPFFFEYYKFNDFSMSSFTEGLRSVRGSIVHYTLYILLLLAGLVSVVFILLPLRLMNKNNKNKNAAILGISFASLGLGFMFFEIGAMQFMNLYLGDPIYSFTVILSGLLFFTGIGSFLAGKLKIKPEYLFKKGLFFSSLSILVWFFYTKVLVSTTLQSDLTIRVLVSLATLVPVGFALGIPFATGMKYLNQKIPRFIPWALGINSIASVMASVLAIILAMNFGFTFVIVSASVSYLTGFLFVNFRFR